MTGLAALRLHSRKYPSLQGMGRVTEGVVAGGEPGLGCGLGEGVGRGGGQCKASNTLPVQNPCGQRPSPMASLFRYLFNLRPDLSLHLKESAKCEEILNYILICHNRL